MFQVRCELVHPYFQLTIRLESYTTLGLQNVCAKRKFRCISLKILATALLYVKIRIVVIDTHVTLVQNVAYRHVPVSVFGTPGTIR